MIKVNDKIMDEKLKQFIEDCQEFSKNWKERFPLVYTKLPEVRECLAKVIERYEGLSPEKKQSDVGERLKEVARSLGRIKWDGYLTSSLNDDVPAPKEWALGQMWYTSNGDILVIDGPIASKDGNIFIGLNLKTEKREILYSEPGTQGYNLYLNSSASPHGYELYDPIFYQLFKVGLSIKILKASGYIESGERDGLYDLIEKNMVGVGGNFVEPKVMEAFERLVQEGRVKP